MTIAEIKTNIRGIVGREILFFETVSSTNTVALERAEKVPEGTVVLADSQDKGRGRHGRVWISPAGVNVYMSIILRPRIKPKDSSLITIMSAVACTEAIRNVTGLTITTKWPNDLMISNKKIGGILTELKTQQQKTIFAIVGIGINVNSDLSDFPKDVEQTATSLKNEAGTSYSREPLIAEILNAIDRWYKILNSLKKEVILQEWKNLTSTLGRKVMVITPLETLTGVAEALDNEGMLIVRLPSGKLQRINSGDLKILQ